MKKDIALIETGERVEEAWIRVLRSESRSDGVNRLEIRALLFTSVLQNPDRYRGFWNSSDSKGQKLLQAVLRDGSLCYLTYYGTNDIPNWEERLTNAAATIGAKL